MGLRDSIEDDMNLGAQLGRLGVQGHHRYTVCS